MKENDNKEINLLQLLEILINWIMSVLLKIVDLIGKWIKLLYKNTILTIITLIICLAVGIYLSRPSERIYQAEALAMIYGSDAQTVREVSKLLEKSSPINKITSFTTKLSLPDSVAKNIVAFHSYYIIEYVKDGIAVKIDYNDNYSQKDTMYVKMRDRVQMQLLTKNINQIPLIQKAILNYFNNNKMLTTHLENTRNHFNQQIRVSQLELIRVDSLEIGRAHV